MQISANSNIKMIRGDSEVLLISCKGYSFVQGDKITFTVRKSRRDTTKHLQKIATEFVDGKAVININPEDTSGMDFGEYIYDVQLDRMDGVVKTIVKPAAFTVELEVTYDD